MPILLIVIILTTLALSIGWLVYSLPGFFAFTSTVINWCKDLFLQCLGYITIAKVSFIWAGVVVTGGGLFYGIIKGIWGIVKAHRIIRGLPKADYGLNIVLIRDDSIQVAFTHGLFRPRVYTSSGLISRLTRLELKAVLLHEIYHKRHKDPLRFFLLSILRDTFFYIPIGRYILMRIHLLREKAADDAAVSSMNESIGLASAIVKIAMSGREDVVAMEPASIRGLDGLEERVKRLVDGRDGSIEPLPALKTVVSSLIIGGILLMSITLPVFASTSLYDLGVCDMGHCSVHVDKLGEGCRAHCDVR